MGINRVPSSVDMAISGLRIEAARMNVIAGNIANSKTTAPPSAPPYRRQQIVVKTSGGMLDLPEIESIAPDMRTALKRVLQPRHPHADKNGYVTMPNVDLPVEMINLVAASRAYQANAAVMKRHQEIMDAAIALLK